MMSPSGVYLRKNAREKYSAILKAACRLFLRNGYNYTNMDSIAEEAGVSKQTVYSYFTNKDILFSKMVEMECTRYKLPEKLLSEALPPKETLLGFGYAISDMVASPRGIAIYRLVVAEAERHPHIARLYYESGPLCFIQAIAGYLKQQDKCGTFCIDDPLRAATYFFSMVKGLLQMRLQLKIKPAPSKQEISVHLRHAVEQFCRLYTA